MYASLKRLAVLSCTALIGIPAYPGTGTAQQAPGFDWMDEIPARATLRVLTVAGDVSVQASPDGTARVRGRTRTSDGGGDASGLRFEMVRDGDDVTICALDDRATCDTEGLHRDGGGGRLRARADFTVQLPAGVALRASSGIGDVRVTGATAAVRASSGNGEVFVGAGADRVAASSGNGDVEVDGARGPVEASSGNGDIVVSTARGPVSASSGNGSIEARMASLPGDGDLEFSSGNGRIVLFLPPDFSADLHATSGTGGFESDFPIRMEGRIGWGRYRGTIGQGGRTLRISTGNGRIELRRLGSID